ncbi:hypothetical protein NC651_036781 [Populus alba x Populus x berolinensis]|nr:hypothetical protein NC651_036781 [Populus alba x Populus x berolinensis]
MEKMVAMEIAMAGSEEDEDAGVVFVFAMMCMVEDGAELSELCSDWKDAEGVLGNPKQELATALLRVRYCLLDSGEEDR